MPPRGERSLIERLRDAVAAHVRANSLRSVAREIGMSPPGLQSFLDGRTPYPATHRKLERWYVREKANVGGDTGVEAAEAAVRILTRDLPDDLRADAARRSVEFYEAVYDAAGTPRPVWLRDLRTALDEGPPTG